MPSSTFIVLYLGNSEFIENCLSSIRQQANFDGEILVVVSGPAPAELMQVTRDICSVVESNIGVPVTAVLNKTLCGIDSDLVVIHNQFDMSEPDRIQNQASIFEEHPEVDVCFGQSSLINHKGQKVGVVENILIDTRSPGESTARIRGLISSNESITTPITSMMFRRTAILEVGGFGSTKEGKYAFTFEMLCRLLLAGKLVYNLEKAVCRCREGYLRQMPNGFEIDSQILSLDELHGRLAANFRRRHLSTSPLVDRSVSQGEFFRNMKREKTIE